MQTRTRALAATAPYFPPVLDTGIPLALLDAGKGAPPRSDATKPRASSDKCAFSVVIDGKLDKTKLGSATSPNTVAHRNALAELLSRQDKTDVGKLKVYLQALVSENKAHSKNADPTSLRLYMGFGDVAPQDRTKASALAWRLRENAVALKGKLGDAECEQMLDWIADAWLFYERAHGPKITGPHAYTTSLYPTELAADHVLQRAHLRAELLAAARDGDVPGAQSLLRKLPAMADLKQAFPAAAPDRFMEEIGNSAKDHIQKFSKPVQAYIAHCTLLSQWHFWVKEHTPHHADAKALFSPHLQDLCHTLRTTQEHQLGIDIDSIWSKIRAALEDPQLIPKLAQQPFASIRTMLDKNTVLEMFFNQSPTLVALRDALEAALNLQSAATEALRAELLNDRFDGTPLTSVLMMAFAQQVTAAPHQTLSTGASTAEKFALRRHLDLLLRNAQNTANGSNGWEKTVLRQLIKTLDM